MSATSPLLQLQISHPTSSVPQNAYNSPPVLTQPLTKFPQMDSGLVVPVFNQGDYPIACLNKAMAFLVIVQQVQGRQVQSYAGSINKGNATSSGGNNAGGQAREKMLLVQAQESGQILNEDQLAFLANPGILNAKAVLIANLSNYGSDVLSEKSQRIKPTLYDGNLISRKHDVVSVTDEEETLILKEVSRSKMLAKQNDPISIKQKINVSPINYVELNQLFKDFSNCFVPQQELSTEQAFWLQTSNPNIEQSDTSPVEIEAPSELSKIILVNTSLKNIKNRLAKFDTVVKKRITPDAITEGSWGFEHTKALFLNEIIPFLKTLKDIFNVFDKDLLDEITEVQTVFNQMEAAVQQYSVDKQCFEIHKKELFLNNDRLLHQIMSQDVMLTVMNSTGVFDNSVNLEMKKSETCIKCFDLEAKLVKKKNMVERDIYT
ncbi:hypothetical protein Tco_1414395 [Tanacetum coccineum]